MQTLSKSNIQYIQSLHQNKYRYQYESFIVEGLKSNIEFLKRQKYETELIVCNDQRVNDILQFLPKVNNEKIRVCAEVFLKKISSLSTTTDVIGIYKMKMDVVAIDKNIFVLDNVQDPGNAGTIIRIADWFGFGTVIRLHDGVDFYNPKLVQATMGSMNNVNLINLSFDEICKLDLPIFTLDMHGKNIKSLELPQVGIYVLGNEGHGLNDKWAAIETRQLAIPGHAKRVAESLNVAITAGIIANHVSLLKS